MKPSALGSYLLVMPGHGCWQVALFSSSGRWGGAATGFVTKAAAHAHRRSLLRHHKRLAASRAGKSGRAK